MEAPTEITVTWGREHVSPIQFCGMDIGPFSATVRLREGETPRQAFDRTMAMLDEWAQDEYRRKLPAFLARVREIATRTRGGG
jgi:hypothetical protein